MGPEWMRGTVGGAEIGEVRGGLNHVKFSDPFYGVFCFNSESDKRAQAWADMASALTPSRAVTLRVDSWRARVDTRDQVGGCFNHLGRKPWGLSPGKKKKEMARI